MDIDYKLLGERIARMRKMKGYSQATLAEWSDISNNYLSNIETGRSIPSLDTTMRICASLKATPNELLLGVAENSKYYLEHDLLELTRQCSPKEKRYLVGFIKLMLKERE